jgi:PAS domain S-box-containing protein
MKQILSRLAPPSYDRPEKARQAELLNAVSLVLLVILTILLLLNIYYDTGLGSAVNPVLLGLILCQVAAQVLIRKGHVRLAGLSLLFLSWLGITWFAVLADGIHDVVIFAYFTILLGAGYMFGLRAFLLFTVISILAIWFLAFDEINGFIHPAMAGPERIALYLTALFVLVSLQIYYILNTLKKALMESTYENQERRRVENVLREEQDKLSFALEAANMGTWSWDIGTGAVEWSEGIEPLFGMQKGEFDGRYDTYISMVYPDDLLLTQNTIRISLEDRDFKYILEHRIVRPDGQVRWLEGRGNVYRNEAGQPVRMAGTVVDVTERKRSEEALRLAEEKYRNIFENSAHGIFQSTPEGKFLNVNPAMARIYGYATPDEFINSFSDISTELYLDPSDGLRFVQAFETGNEIFGFEAMNRKKDGSIIYVSSNARAVRDPTGVLRYYEGSVENITQRKESEAERERLLGELAAKNAELERFVYTVSHDLKSPLVTIMGYLGFLEKDFETGNMAALHKDMDRIYWAARKMQDLLKDLLDLSRIGRLINEPERVPFYALVKDALDLTEGRLRERSVQVEVEPGLPDVYGDAKRLVELLQNLVDNAAKYMGDQPKPLIRIGQAGLEEEKTIFFVRDNGMGIDPEYQEQIFGLFNKLDPNMEGTGVGLALCKRIVEVHGGRIWVVSKPGDGATFFFTLPQAPRATKSS